MNELEVKVIKKMQTNKRNQKKRRKKEKGKSFKTCGIQPNSPIYVSK
jgi:hypothetical protein